MKEIIIRMKTKEEVYGPNIDPNEIQRNHTGLEIEYDGMVHKNVEHLVVDITAPKFICKLFEYENNRWKCGITTQMVAQGPDDDEAIL